jgi:hypothetical protein
VTTTGARHARPQVRQAAKEAAIGITRESE